MVLGLTACGTSSEVANGATVDAETFAAAIKQPDTVVLDVRTPAEFSSGAIEGAVNIDVNSSDFAAGIAKLDKTKHYALYCRSGNRSATAMKRMQDAGFSFVYHLGGGIGAWQRAGKPVVTP